MALDPQSLFALGGVTAIIAAGWRYVKMVWDFLSSFIVGHMTINDSDIEVIVFNYLWRNHRRLSLTGSRAISSVQEPIRITGRHEMVACEGNMMMRWVFWINGRPLFWNKDVRKSDGAVRQGGVGWIRGTVDMDAIVRNAMIEYRKRFNVNHKTPGSERFAVYMMHGNSAGGMGALAAIFERNQQGGAAGSGTNLVANNAPEPAGAPKAQHSAQSGMVHQLWLETTRFFDHSLEDFGRAQVLKSLQIMALDEGAMDIVEECERWLKSEEWFRKRGVPWRRGYLFYGPPGTGKTSLLRAIAEYLDIPIFVLDIGTMNNQELMKNWMNAVTSAPCMVAVEDVDGVFHGRENVMGEKGGGLSFDAFLNTIDGLDRCNGIIFAVTTNRIDLVDPALGRPSEEDQEISTRPGRIDRVVYLKNPDEEGRRKIAQRILCDWPDEVDRLVAEGSKDTGAQFQDRCVRLAQKLFWPKKAA